MLVDTPAPASASVERDERIQEGKGGLASPVWQELLKPYRGAYSKYLAGVILRQAILVLGGYSMVWAIRLCTGRRNFPEWPVVAALLLFDAVYLSLDTGLNTLFTTQLSFPLFGRMRIAALEKIFQMPMEWHQEQSSGTLLGQVNNGVGRVMGMGEAVSRELLPAAIRTFLSLVPLLLLSLYTAPLLLLALGLFSWLTLRENNRRAALRRKRHACYVRDSGKFGEYVQAAQPVVQFGQTQRLLADYGRLQERIVRLGRAEMRVANAYSWRRSLVLSLAKRVSQGIWIWQLRRGALDVAMVMYLNMLTEELLASFWGYAGLLERIFEGLEPARILVKLLNEQPAVRDQPGPAPASDEERGIDMIDVQFSYSRGKQIIRNLNLSIKRGEVLGIVGRSGSGKTTIQNLLSRIFEVQRGAITVYGADIRQWPLSRLRGLFACVSQNGGVFFSGMTLFDTIRFARPEATFREVVEAAKCACIHEDIIRLPAKYRTKMKAGGVNLSKGQQQRIALAQALLALKDDRKILVLDEFTSQLDSETESKILANLLPHLAGRTVILIAHRLSTLRQIADRIAVLEDGRIIEQGAHEELVRSNGWYAEMARAQAVT